MAKSVKLVCMDLKSYMECDMHEGFIYSLVLSGAQAGSNSLSLEQIENGIRRMVYSGCTFAIVKKGAPLDTNSSLPKVESDALLAQDTRPRAVIAGEGILLALRGVNLNPNSSSRRHGGRAYLCR